MRVRSRDRRAAIKASRRARKVPPVVHERVRLARIVRRRAIEAMRIRDLETA